MKNQWLKTAIIGLILLPVAGSAGWLSHDNGDAWGQVFAMGQYDGFGVKFSPNDTGVIMRMQAYLGLHDEDWDGFDVWLYGWNGTLEEPNNPGGSEVDLGELTGSGGSHDWFELDFTDQDWTTTDPFVIALTNKFSEPRVDTIYKDSENYSPGDLYWELQSGTWDTYNPEKHLMVQVWFSGSPVESTSLGSIKAVFK